MPTVSSASAAASRANGRRSHGPVTAEGRARSAQNALKHGLTATVPRLLASEDVAAFEAEHRQLLLRVRPVGEIEIELVRKATWSAWLVRRADRLMAEFLDRIEIGPEGQRAAGAALAEDPRLVAAFRSLERHRARLQREHDRAVAALHDALEERALDAQNEPGAAAEEEEEEAPPAPAGPVAALNRQQRRRLAHQERRRSA